MVGFGSSKGKHSFDNAVRSGEFVLNLISEDFAKEAVALEKKHELNEDRVKEVGLSLIDSNNIKTQGISEAEVRIECKFKKIVEIPGSDHKLILGEVLSGFCSKVTPEGHADYTALKLLMHVGGSEFRKIGEKVEIERNK